MPSKFKKGQEYESIVCAFYAHFGFELVDRNVHYKFGEIDLVMYKDFYVFIEVKSTLLKVDAYNLLSEAKVINVHDSVEYYCMQKHIDEYRVDYCCVIPHKDNYEIAIVRGI